MQVSLSQDFLLHSNGISFSEIKAGLKTLFGSKVKIQKLETNKIDSDPVVFQKLKTLDRIMGAFDNANATDDDIKNVKALKALLK